MSPPVVPSGSFPPRGCSLETLRRPLTRSLALPAELLESRAPGRWARATLPYRSGEWSLEEELDGRVGALVFLKCSVD